MTQNKNQFPKTKKGITMKTNRILRVKVFFGSLMNAVFSL